MAGNNSIQFLRGTQSQIKGSAQVALAGQPVYATDTNYLYIGDGSTQIKNLDAIKASYADKAGSDGEGNNIADTYAKQNGSYPTLGAGYFAKQLKISPSSAYTGFIKIGTVPFNAVNEWQCYNCIMLISGIYRGSSPSTSTPMPTGQIEIEIRKYSTGFSDDDTRIGLLCGDIETSDIFYVYEENKDMSIYFNITGAEQVTIECEIMSEQTGDTDNPSIFVFDGQTKIPTAPSGAVYAVNRNHAADSNKLGGIAASRYALKLYKHIVELTVSASTTFINFYFYSTRSTKYTNVQTCLNDFMSNLTNTRFPAAGMYYTSATADGNIVAIAQNGTGLTTNLLIYLGSQTSVKGVAKTQLAFGDYYVEDL